MMWQTPKTDWTPDDTYNATNFNRVEQNTAHLATMPVYWCLLTLAPHRTDWDAKSWPFAGELNRIEQNIDKLRKALYTPIVQRYDVKPLKPTNWKFNEP